ncbi:MAG: hypothetical protein UY63_C0002G0019 [Parcubacteria group bacterium GW2011_GWA2_51_10]|nr:MAG: hypothetical protein UY63_C0002G0019 [Parcubacteria group bacterium GW2011_GWA2_51_10]
MIKYVIGIVVVIVIVAGGYYVWRETVRLAIPTQTVPTVTEPAMSTYATSTFSIKYPSAYTVNDSYAYDQFGSQKLIHGVKFTIPEEMATGTNLAVDTGISLESLPRARNCTGDIYLTANVRAEKITENGTDFSFATSSGAAAGNLYEEFVYALSTSSPCTAVRYFIHSGNIGNYPQAGEPGAVREFDREALIAEFDKIRLSLILNR